MMNPILYSIEDDAGQFQTALSRLYDCASSDRTFAFVEDLEHAGVITEDDAVIFFDVYEGNDNGVIDYADTAFFTNYKSAARFLETYPYEIQSDAGKAYEGVLRPSGSMGGLPVMTNSTTQVSSYSKHDTRWRAMANCEDISDEELSDAFLAEFSKVEETGEFWPGFDFKDLGHYGTRGTFRRMSLVLTEMGRAEALRRFQTGVFDLYFERIRQTSSQEEFEHHLGQLSQHLRGSCNDMDVLCGSIAMTESRGLSSAIQGKSSLTTETSWLQIKLNAEVLQDGALVQLAERRLSKLP